MESVRLTKSAEYLLCVLYDSYLQRVKNGESSSRAKSIGGSGQIKDNFIKSWSVDDVDEAIKELSRKDMVSAFFADNSVWNCSLSSDGISYMEHRFGDKFDQLMDRIAALRSAIFI